MMVVDGVLQSLKKYTVALLKWLALLFMNLDIILVWNMTIILTIKLEVVIKLVS